MTAVIICNGKISDYSYYNKYFEKADFIICVDGGAAHARQFGVILDVLIGDFDSISQSDFYFYKDAGTEIIKFPAEKDMTDSELAIELAIERGADTIIILGGLGSRIDHLLSNIFILKKLSDAGVSGIIADEQNEVTIINDKIQLQRENSFKVTLLPITEKVEGVTTKGLYYPLFDATIVMGSTWGVSNEFSSDIAEVTIRSGLLLVIKSRD